MKNKKISRVDLQVSLFTAIVVMLSFLCIYIIYYHVTYADMINSLKERVFAIHNYLDDKISNGTFAEISSIEDEDKESYKNLKNVLDNIKEATGVMYLYTAKKNSDGDFVYVVDGLDYSAPDFRHPGDLIEKEIYSSMERALLGEVILPKDIKKTDWGKIFITYFPIHEGDEIVGVLGIEFEAEHQYNTYHMLKIITPLIALTACFIAMNIAIVLFKRISNPSHQDMFNTDQLSQLKNRNAYDIDIQNMAVTKRLSGVAMVVMDLNHLKYVNDHMGHYEGDRYIQCASSALKSAAGNDAVSYRVGGDEFIMIIRDADQNKAEDCMERIQTEFMKLRFTCDKNLSIAMGYAIYDEELDQDLYDTGKRADQMMYENKKNYYKKVEKQIIG